MIIHKIESKTAHLKKRVAAYARVSTAAEEQQESLNTQIDYYTSFIQQNPSLEFVNIYTDPGKSGTSAVHRPGFQKMIADAKAGLFDVILVKSISRFSRNITDAQKYVHELKSYGVEVRFEREAISSFDSSSDMVFSILAAVAQEESRSISENVKWSYRKLGEKGIRHIDNNRVLGYDEINGVFTPNKDAWIIKQVFTDYANGLPLSIIVQRLNESGAKRLRCDKLFTIDMLYPMLDNEIYIGDRLLQKEAPQNHLTKRPDFTVSYNSYYVKNDHTGIISYDLWDRVQERYKQESTARVNGIHKRSYTHFLYGVVFCGKCGKPYIRETEYHKGRPLKVWKCFDRKHGAKCKSHNINEDDLLHAISDELGWTKTDDDS